MSDVTRLFHAATTGDRQAPAAAQRQPVALRFTSNGYELITADKARTARVWNLITQGDLSGTPNLPL